jgi:hypothetical protein
LGAFNSASSALHWTNKNYLNGWFLCCDLIKEKQLKIQIAELFIS